MGQNDETESQINKRRMVERNVKYLSAKESGWNLNKGIKITNNGLAVKN